MHPKNWPSIIFNYFRDMTTSVKSVNMDVISNSIIQKMEICMTLRIVDWTNIHIAGQLFKFEWGRSATIYPVELWWPGSLTGPSISFIRNWEISWFGYHFRSIFVGLTSNYSDHEKHSAGSPVPFFAPLLSKKLSSGQTHFWNQRWRVCIRPPTHQNP